MIALAFAVVVLASAAVYSCNDDHSHMDCSRREKPMYYDKEQQRWTCEDRTKR